MVLSSTGVSAGILSLFTAIFITIVNARKIFARYREKKQFATLFLLLAAISWTAMGLSASVVYFSAAYNLAVAQVFQRLIYAGVVGGAIFMFLFASEIFFQISKVWKQVYVAIGVALVVLIVVLDSSFVVYIDQNYPVLLIREEFGVTILIYYIPALMGIFIKALGAAKRMENRLYKAGYQYIAYGQVFGLASVLVDTLGTFVMDDLIFYSTCLNLTWVFLMVAMWCYFIGWVLPPGFRRRYEFKEAGEKEPELK